VQRERPAHPPLPALVEHAHPLAHEEGGAQRALRIVLVRARRAEYRHDRVAHELLDEALVAVDRRGHLAEEIALDRAHVLGIEPFAERGEPGQVREEHGDRPAIAFGGGGRSGRRRRGRGGREPGSALGAEREVGGRLEAAAATRHVDGATSISWGIGMPRRASSPSRSSARVPTERPPGTVQNTSNSRPSGSFAYSDRLTPWSEEPTSECASMRRRRARTRSVSSPTSQAEWYMRTAPSSGPVTPGCAKRPR